MKTEDWHAEFVQSLEEASDMARQRSAWLARTSTDFFPEPVELICQLFDDTGMIDLLAKGPVFSEATDAAFLRLSAMARGIDVEQDPERLLASEGWLEFVRQAARVLALVRAELEDVNQ